jgi:hypothetical protein
MSFITVIIAVVLPLGCIGAAATLMRIFDVEEATLEQAQSEAEKLLTQVNREVAKRRRVRAGVPSNAQFADFRHLASLSETRIRFPTA